MKAPYIIDIRCFHFISSSFSLKHMTQSTEYSLFSCECRLYIGCSFQILEMLLFASIEVFWNVNRYIYNQVTYSITINTKKRCTQITPGTAFVVLSVLLFCRVMQPAEK